MNIYMKISTNFSKKKKNDILIYKFSKNEFSGNLHNIFIQF